MGSFSGPGIVVNNLLLAVDCANSKSYDSGENLLADSEQINNWSTPSGATTISTNFTTIPSPVGTFTVDKIIGTNGTTGRQSRYKDNTATASTKYTFSVFLKAAERRYATIWFDHDNTFLVEGGYVGASSYIDLQTGTLVPGFGTATQIIAYPNGWYRVYVTATTTSTFTGTLRTQIGIGTPNNTGDGASTTAYQYTGDGTSGIYVWGAQLEEGGNLTNYTPTTTTAKTRSTQILNLSSTTNNFSLSVPGYYDFTISNSGAIDFNRTLPPTAETGGYAQISPTSGSLAASTYLLNDHTTEIWFKVDNRNSTGYTPPANAENNSALVVYQGFHSMWYYNTTQYAYSIWGNGTIPYTLLLPDTTTGVWNQLVAVRSGTTLTLYKNGVSQVSGTITSDGIGAVSNSFNVIRIAMANDAINEYSWLADLNFGLLRMYGRGLTASEVQQNFNATRGRFSI